MTEPTLDLAATEAALTSGVVAFEGRRDVIEVVGPDAVSYLQGQVSQDVVGLGVGTSTWSFVLAPQGKVDGWFRLTRLGDDRFLLDLDAGHGQGVLTRLQRFKLRTKADLTLSTRRLVAVRGPQGAALEPGDFGGLAVGIDWPGIVGFDLLDPDTDPAVGWGHPQALEALRIRAGFPALGSELDESTIPAEAGIVDVSVSFTKGCYVGQELVARVDSRGNNTPRRLLGLRLEGFEAPEPGSELHGSDGIVGRITSAAATDGDVVVALAYAKRGTEPGTEVSVVLPSGVRAIGHLRSLPF